MSCSNKCNKIFGQSCRENLWTPNKSDPWGQNTPFCHDNRRVKTILLVNKTLLPFSAWNSFHLLKKFLFKQLYALFRAFCREPLANKWHFACCNIYTLRKLSQSKAHWNVIAFRTQNNSPNSTWNCNLLNMILRNPIYTPTISLKPIKDMQQHTVFPSCAKYLYITFAWHRTGSAMHFKPEADWTI